MTPNGGEGVNRMNQMTKDELAKWSRELNANRGVSFGRACISRGMDIFEAQDMGRLFAGPDMADEQAFLAGITHAYLSRP
jgi:hypothetical protein